MLFAFIDESYTQDRYYVGAYVIPEEQVREVRAARVNTMEYAAGFGVHKDSELHGHEIMSGAGEWAALRGKHRAATAIFGRALQEFAAVPEALVIIEGVDIPRLNARYSYPQPPHLVTFRHTLERLHERATRMKKEVIVFADVVQDQENHERRARQYQAVGTGGFRSSTLSTIQMPIRWSNSRESPGLQAADLFVYLYRRLDAHVETSAKARKAKSLLWSYASPIIRSHRRWDP